MKFIIKVVPSSHFLNEVLDRVGKETTVFESHKKFLNLIENHAKSSANVLKFLVSKIPHFFSTGLHENIF